MSTTTIAQQLPITNLLSESNFDFQNLKNELNKKIAPEDEKSEKYYHINIKETDDLGSRLPKMRRKDC